MLRSGSNLSVCRKGNRSVPSFKELELELELGAIKRNGKVHLQEMHQEALVKQKRQDGEITLMHLKLINYSPL